MLSSSHFSLLDNLCSIDVFPFLIHLFPFMYHSCCLTGSCTCPCHYLDFCFWMSMLPCLLQAQPWLFTVKTVRRVILLLYFLTYIFAIVTPQVSGGASLYCNVHLLLLWGTRSSLLTYLFGKSGEKWVLYFCPFFSELLPHFQTILYFLLHQCLHLFSQIKNLPHNPFFILLH